MLAIAASASEPFLARVGSHSSRWTVTRTHGMRKSPEYRSYAMARNRCKNPNADRWAEYGGRGIEFRFVGFEAFFAEVGPRPSLKHSVDRMDNNGHYEPGNVRWALHKDQCRNRRSTRMLEFQGRTQSMAAWGEELGIPAGTIFRRLQLGWDVERALSTPVKKTTPR